VSDDALARRSAAAMFERDQASQSLGMVIEEVRPGYARLRDAGGWSPSHRCVPPGRPVVAMVLIGPAAPTPAGSITIKALTEHRSG